MKEKKLRSLQLICLVILIIGSGAFFISGYMVPGLMPICMAILMFGLWAQSRLSYKNGKLSKNFFITCSIGLFLGVILNTMVSISQLINFRNNKLSSSIGVIGGADGLTAIFVTFSFARVGLVLTVIATIILAVMIAFIIRKMMKK